MREGLLLFLSSGGCKSAGTGMHKQKHLPRIHTELHGRKKEEGRRKKKAEAED